MKNKVLICRFRRPKWLRATTGARPVKQSTKLSTVFNAAFRPSNRCTGLLLAACLAAGPGLAETAPAADPAGVPAAADLLRAAQAGDAWAQLNVGSGFDHGMGGFPLDPVRAVAWYRHAAEAGLAEAQFNLAHCLVSGNGATRNDAEALGWMLKAAGQGLPSAQFLAGVMLAEGIGTSADHAQAMVWLERAAANGNLDAGLLLERMRAKQAADPAAD